LQILTSQEAVRLWAVSFFDSVAEQLVRVPDFYKPNQDHFESQGFNDSRLWLELRVELEN
jgi:hypothetical protein